MQADGAIDLDAYFQRIGYAGARTARSTPCASCMSCIRRPSRSRIRTRWRAGRYCWTALRCSTNWCLVAAAVIASNRICCSAMYCEPVASDHRFASHAVVTSKRRHDGNRKPMRQPPPAMVIRLAGKMVRMRPLKLLSAASTGRSLSTALLLVFCLTQSCAYAACSDAPAAGVDWKGCDKQRLILRKAELQGAHLDGAEMDGTDLAQANLSGADLSRASVDRARFSEANLERAKLVRLIAYRTNFTGAKLAGADLTKAELMRSNFSGANLSGANLEKAELQRATLGGATLTGANLTGADLGRTNLVKAKLGDARFSQARMFLTRIEGVDLSSAAGMVQSQLDTACGNTQTKLPKGLKAPATWPCPADE